MKDQKERRYYYPLRNPDDPEKITLVEISEAEYRALYPEIWLTRKREREMGRCMCPRRMLWMCDGDCPACRFHAAGRILSLDRAEEMSGEIGAGDDPSDLVGDRILLLRLLERLEELCPGASAVGGLRQSGYSEREALEKLGLSRMTYRNRLKAAENMLREEFGEIF